MQSTSSAAAWFGVLSGCKTMGSKAGTCLLGTVNVLIKK